MGPQSRESTRRTVHPPTNLVNAVQMHPCTQPTRAAEATHRSKPPSPLAKRSWQNETSPLTGSLIVFQTLQNARGTQLEQKRQNRSDDSHDGSNPEGCSGRTFPQLFWFLCRGGSFHSGQSSGAYPTKSGKSNISVRANSNHPQTLSTVLLEKQDAGIKIW